MTLATDQNSDDAALSFTAQAFLGLRGAVIARWEHDVRLQIDGADALLGPVLTNTIPAFFDNIAEALSPDYPRADANSNNNAAAVHGGERARMTPFGPDQVIHEYQLLRAAIVAETAGRLALTPADWRIIDRSIDVAIREAVREFTSIHEDLRRKLAGALSHDMRTPLSIIANGAELIKMVPDVPAAQRTAQKIAASAARLGHMMNDLLDAMTYNGGEKLPLTLGLFDIAELVDEVRDAYTRPGGIDIGTQAEPVRGNWCRGSLRRALENLVNNAAAYGDGGSVNIMTTQAHGRLMLSVHNTGNPIPKERQGRIFEYFVRDNAAAAPTGWGLGLPFVKRVAESHGGSVIVDSSAETGTTFLIDIPVNAVPPAVQPSAAQRVATPAVSGR